MRNTGEKLREETLNSAYAEELLYYPVCCLVLVIHTTSASFPWQPHV